DPNGVRIFFHQGPVAVSGAGTITVVGDGVGTFTGTDQPYYQYDELLNPDETSDPKSWLLQVPPTVDAFAFLLYVAAEVEHPDGWLELVSHSEDPRLLQGETDSLEI